MEKSLTHVLALAAGDVDAKKREYDVGVVDVGVVEDDVGVVDRVV